MALSVMMESSLSVRPLAHSEQCRFSVDVWWCSYLPAERPAGIIPSLLDLAAAQVVTVGEKESS